MAHKQRFGGGLALLAVTLAGVSASGVWATEGAPEEWRSGPSVVIASKSELPLNGTPLGAAPAAAHLERLLLLLEPSAAHRQALDAELKNQQDPKSAEYHRWLTPSQFADTYANSAPQVAAIISWLESEGLKVAPLPSGRGWIEVSGTVAQIEQAFHTRIQTVTAAGGTRFALADSVAVPATLRPLIHGLASLDGVLAQAAITSPLPVADLAEVSAAASSTRAAALTPQNVAPLLHLDSLHSSGMTGAAESIAIAARSNVQPQDVAAFRAAFTIPAKALQVQLNGADPGRTEDEAAAVMSASWAGAAAPGAHIVLVPAATTAATDGLDLSLASIVDQALARTVVVGFSSCEAALSEAHQAFYAALYRQASAQGIAIIAAAGDSGASACHASGADTPASTGFGVNALASTPWNTSVGAVALDEAGTGSGLPTLSGWSPRNPADPAYAGGGGTSNLYPISDWQPLPEHLVAAASDPNTRLVPDLSLPTAIDSNVNPGLVFCLGSPASPAGGTKCNAVRAGGTAAAAALFGGVAAIIAANDGPQGNLAPRLYQLSRRSGIFIDVQQGNARLPCASGSPGCDAAGKIGFEAAPGFDLATGLGSIDAAKLVHAWATPDASGTGASSVGISVTPTVPNTTYNPTAQITLTATVVSGTGGATPTGTVVFADATNGTNLNPSGSTLDANGVANYTFTSGLVNGGNNLTANYSGDTTYAAQKSQTLVVNIQPSTTSLTVVPSTTTPTAGLPFSVTVNVAVGSPPAGTVAPTGKVTLNVDGLPTATASFVTSGSATVANFPSVTINAGGGHPLQAVYAGDPNYGASTSPPVTVTIGKGATVTTLTATPATLTAGMAESFTATIAPANAAAGATYSITGTVSFYDGTTLLGAPVAISANAATLPNITLTTGVLHTITAVYSGDSSWSASTSNALALQTALLPDSVTLAVNINTTGPGQVVNLLATVNPLSPPAANIEQNPTGKIIFYNGTTALGSVALSAGVNNSSTATLTTGSLPGGQNVLTAYYAGDPFYAPGTSNPVTITVQDFALSFPGTPPADLDIIKGSSGQATLVVTGLGGFNDLIQLACAVPTQDDMTCTASPDPVAPTSNVTITVQTFSAGGTTASGHPPAPLWPRALGETALAFLVFFLVPFGRRARLFSDRVRGAMVLLPLLAGLSGAGIGCSSTNLSTVGGGTGTPLGQTTLKITGASNVDNTVVSRSVYLTVNVLPPGSTGTVVPYRGRRK